MFINDNVCFTDVIMTWRHMLRDVIEAIKSIGILLFSKKNKPSIESPFQANFQVKTLFTPILTHAEHAGQH